MQKTKMVLALWALSTAALADINVGVTLSATGPAASLGIPEKNTIDLFPGLFDLHAWSYSSGV